MEKELRAQIIAEAEEFKIAFYEKRIQNCETNKVHNREREKVCEKIIRLISAFVYVCKLIYVDYFFWYYAADFHRQSGEIPC